MSNRSPIQRLIDQQRINYDSRGRLRSRAERRRRQRDLNNLIMRRDNAIAHYRIEEQRRLEEEEEQRQIRSEVGSVLNNLVQTVRFNANDPTLRQVVRRNRRPLVASRASFMEPGP